MTRVLLADDHTLLREGLRRSLEDAGVEVVGEAGDGEQAIEEARRLRPQIILMDLHLPGVDGASATRTILSEQAQTGIVALTGVGAEEDVLSAIRAGALGYLSKTAPREEFLQAIRRVAQGETWLPPHLTRRLLAHVKPPADEAPEPLTGRECEVLTFMARGLSNRQISRELNIVEATVRTHVSHILGKLGASNRVEAALHALRSGLAHLQDR